MGISASRSSLKRKLWAAVLIAAASFATPANAATYLIGGVEYAPSGLTETMASSFLQADGGISVNSYSNFVEVIVSGSGNSYLNRQNDAFHFFTGPLPPPGDPYYQLTFSRSTIFPFASRLAAIAVNSIAFDIDANSAVAAPYTPAYRSDHTYHLVLAVGAPTTQLHFGVADGDYGDNGGSYSLTLMQLAPLATPIPAALPLFASGLGAMGLLAWRRKRKSAAILAA